MTTNQILRDALTAVRNSLQFINDTPGGAITDTLWMMDQPETVFDHIDAALATADADQGSEPQRCDFGNPEDFNEAHTDWMQEQHNAEVGALIYNGNTVSYMYSKAKNYGDVVLAAHKLIGKPGHVLDTLKALITERDALAARPAPVGAVQAPGSTGDDAELVALLDGYARDGTRGYQHYLEQIKAWAARQPVAVAPAASNEKCRLRLCCRDDVHAADCTTYDPTRKVDEDAPAAPIGALTGVYFVQHSGKHDCKEWTEVDGARLSTFSDAGFNTRMLYTPADLHAKPEPVERPSHEEIIREGDSLVCTACGTSSPVEQAKLAEGFDTPRFREILKRVCGSYGMLDVFEIEVSELLAYIGYQAGQQAGAVDGELNNCAVRVFEAWESSPIKSRDGLLFERMLELREQSAKWLASATQKGE